MGKGNLVNCSSFSSIREGLCQRLILPPVSENPTSHQPGDSRAASKRKREKERLITGLTSRVASDPKWPQPMDTVIYPKQAVVGLEATRSLGAVNISVNRATGGRRR